MGMEVEYRNENLKKLYSDSSVSNGLAIDVIRSYRLAMQVVYAAMSTSDLENMNFLGIKRIDEDKISFRLQGEHRLIIKLKRDDLVEIVEIVRLT